MKNFIRLMGMLKPYKWWTLLVLVLLVLATVADYVTPLFLKQVLDVGIGSKDMELVGKLAIVMILVYVFRVICVYFQNLFMEIMGQKIALDLRNTLYSHMQKLSFSFFDKMQTGQIMSRLTGDIDCVRGFLGNAFVNLIVCFLNFVFTIGLFVWMNWKLAVIVLLPTPLLMASIVIFAKKINPVWESLRIQAGKLTTVLQENITGIRVVKAFAREVYEAGKFDSRNSDNFNEHMRRAGIEANAFPAMDFLASMNFLLLLLVGGYYVITDK